MKTFEEFIKDYKEGSDKFGGKLCFFKEDKRFSFGAREITLEEVKFIYYKNIKNKRDQKLNELLK